MVFENLLNYDETNPSSIEKYAKQLIGQTFKSIYDKNKNVSFIKESAGDYGKAHKNRNRKGGLGELIEECFFHYKCNNDSEPDFNKAGVELKVTPYKINQNGSISAKERLIITMIDYCSVINESFEKSHFWMKCRLILLIYYLYQKELEDRLDYQINYVKLYSPPERDLKIIKNDFKIIIDKIKAGKAHELSESDTLYLGAAPKAATAKNRRKQPYSDILAKPRAFALKNSYMTYVLNNYIASNKITYEPIIKDNQVDSLEDYVVNKIKKYKGYSVFDLCKEFNVTYSNKLKNYQSKLAFKILGIKGNNAEEFEKANIVVKAIRISNQNTIKEHMSFPTFKFKDLVEENWENSNFGNYLRETKFFFIVYKYDKDNVLRLCGCQFWNIPYCDLEIEVKKVWEKTKRVLLDGLKIVLIKNRKLNNLPKSSENLVCHVRPHAKNSNDTYELPDGRQFPKQCFWLNNSYILSQLNNEFFE